MKFIIHEPILTTITNEDIVGEENIKNLLANFVETGQIISLTIEDPETVGFVRQIDNARILKINEDSANIQGFYGTATIKINNIPFLNFIKIKSIYNKQQVGLRHKVTKWHKLDIAEID